MGIHRKNSSYQLPPISPRSLESGKSFRLKKSQTAPVSKLTDIAEGKIQDLMHKIPTSSAKLAPLEAPAKEPGPSIKLTKRALLRDFNKAVEVCLRSDWEEIRNEAMAPLEDVEVEVKYCGKMYVNAARSTFPFIILGNGGIREDSSMLQNLGIISAQPDSEAVTLVKEGRDVGQLRTRALTGEIAKSHFRKGAVLVDQNWSMARNDALILGAIRGRKEFHLATPGGKIPSAGNIWGKEFGLRVFGREISMLCNAGYKMHVFPKGNGIVFAPSDDVKDQSLSDVREMVGKVRSPSDILSMMEKARVAVTIGESSSS